MKTNQAIAAIKKAILSMETGVNEQVRQDAEYAIGYITADIDLLEKDRSRFKMGLASVADALDEWGRSVGAPSFSGNYDNIRAHVDAVCHRLKAPSTAPADGWQPIETAPKDGTRVDLWFYDDGEGYRFADARWMEDHVLGYEWHVHRLDTDQWEPIGELGTLCYATHWQPLPAPPQGEACPSCQGTGEQIEFSYGRIPEHPDKVPCDVCQGTGKAGEMTL